MVFLAAMGREILGAVQVSGVRPVKTWDCTYGTVALGMLHCCADRASSWFLLTLVCFFTRVSHLCKHHGACFITALLTDACFLGRPSHHHGGRWIDDLELLRSIITRNLHFQSYAP